jgi:dimeric dUTPase (all-alpha-NTP-PPase superfamily)
MDAKDRTSLWKKWKGKHENVRAMKFSELSYEDQNEAKYEAIDALHFWMNVLLAMDLTSEDIFKFYVTKNAENHRRAQNGY